MSAERMIAKQISEKTGSSLVYINDAAFYMVEAGLAETRLDALKYILANVSNLATV